MGPVDLICENVEEDLTVAVSPQVAVEERTAAVEEVAEVLCVGEVAIVDEVDAERAVDEEGLSLLSRGGSSGRIADL